jgi:hypothetical protein
MGKMAVMGELKGPGDHQPAEVRSGMAADIADLEDAFDEKHLMLIIHDPTLTARNKAEIVHALSRVRARRSKRMPPRSTTPPPLPATIATFKIPPRPTTESIAAAPAPRKDESCPPVGEATPSPTLAAEVYPAPVEEAPLSPERIAELEAMADRKVDRALAKPARAARS